MRKLQEACTYPLVELDVLSSGHVLLHTISRKSLFGRYVEQQCKMRSHAARRLVVKAPDQVQIEPAAVPLVGQRRVGESVAHHNLTSGQSRDYYL